MLKVMRANQTDVRITNISVCYLCFALIFGFFWKEEAHSKSRLIIVKRHQWVIQQ